MGWFSDRKKRKRERLDKEMNALAAAEKRKIEANAKQAWSMVKDVDVKPRMLRPDYDLSKFVFGNREYVCAGSVRYSKDNGEVLNDQRFFYADDDALKSFLLDLDDLESMIYGPALGIPSLPPLHSKFSLMRPINRPADMWDNSAKLSLHPYTKTGRNSKYPVSVHFNAYSLLEGRPYPGHDGSHGSVYYCQDGKIGKADVHYWDNGTYFGVYWKVIDGQIAIGSIDYLSGGSQEKATLYRR